MYTDALIAPTQFNASFLAMHRAISKLNLNQRQYPVAGLNTCSKAGMKVKRWLIHHLNIGRVDQYSSLDRVCTWML